MPEHFPVRRGLGGLDPQLPVAARACAERLRQLHSRTGLSSGTLAERLREIGLKVDQTRLSKYLNGREVPRLEFATAIHRVLVDIEGGEVSRDEVLKTRGLMYAAAQRSPLQAREFQLAEALETAEHLRRESKQALRELQADLEAERAKREAAQDALAALESRTLEELRELSEQRDRAQRRVRELEEQIRQNEGILRFRTTDARYLARMAGAADLELALRGFEVDVDNVPEVYRLLVSLRNSNQDEQVNRLLEQFIAPPPGEDLDYDKFPNWPIFNLYTMFIENRRRRDAQRLVRAAVGSQDPDHVFYLTSSIFFDHHDDLMIQDDDPRRYWCNDILPILAGEAPRETLLRFYRTCIETDGEENLAGALREHVLLTRLEPEKPDDPYEAELYRLARHEAAEREHGVQQPWHQGRAAIWAGFEE